MPGDLPRLTKPQAAALGSLVTDGPQVWSRNWPPGAKLWSLGLATRRPRGITTCTFAATEAGRALLARAETEAPHAR